MSAEAQYWASQSAGGSGAQQVSTPQQPKNNFWQNNDLGSILSGGGTFLGSLFTGIGNLKNDTNTSFMPWSNTAINNGGSSTPGNNANTQPQLQKSTNWLLWGGIILAVVVVIVILFMALRKSAA